MLVGEMAVPEKGSSVPWRRDWAVKVGAAGGLVMTGMSKARHSVKRSCWLMAQSFLVRRGFLEPPGGVSSVTRWSSISHWLVMEAPVLRAPGGGVAEAGCVVAGSFTTRPTA